MSRPREAPAVRSQLLQQLFDIQDQRGMSSSELEARSGVSDSNISLMRRGMRRVTVNELEWMAEALGYFPVLAKGRRAK